MILYEDKLGLFMNIKTYTLNRKELFDYKSKDTKDVNTIIENDTFIIRKGETILRADRHSDIEARKGEELLFYIRSRKNEIFSLENPIPKNMPLKEDIINSLNNKIWYVLNSNNPNIDNSNNEDYYLGKDDIIKIGNIKLIVQEIKIEKNEGNEQEEKNMKNNENISFINNRTEEPIFNFFPEPKQYFSSTNDAKQANGKCSICKKDQCNKDNPIIGFCNCNVYHFQCLKDFMEKKIIIKESKNKNVQNFYIEEFICKKCKCIFPLKFTIHEGKDENERIYNFIDIIKPEGSNYMILESLETKIFCGHKKLLFVIKLGNDVIKIGREKENDVIIRDPSVSKINAEITVNNKGIMIKNKSETFGTLILQKKPVKINDNSIKLQIGRTVIDAKKMKYVEYEKIKNKYSRTLPKKD